MKNNEWLKRDLSVLWHPCTQMKDHETLPLIPIKSGKGVWLKDFEENTYLDAISSWWVNLFGHANPHINQALKDQVDQLEHVLLAGFSHEPVITLAEKLIEKTPPELKRCFFVDNGSSAVEASLKMSYHYWFNKGYKKKTKFITLSNSYHGETLGALAVGDVELYKDTYKPLLMETLTVPSPDCFLRAPDMSWQQHCELMFEHMEATLKEHADEACAVIVEPLVQCAGNMRMYHPIYLTMLREACNRHGVHLIADEIAVGFGRTGSFFACEQADISPDFLCLSKGLTAGYLPLSVVVTTQGVYDAFYDDYENMTAFLHSHSYTGNPLACRVALSSLEIFENNNVIENNKKLAEHMRKACEPLQDHPHVAEVRQTGMIVAIELCKDKKTRTPYPWQERRGLSVYLHALKKGVLLRPLGNVVYFMPPYIITPDEIDIMVDAAKSGIYHATQNA